MKVCNKCKINKKLVLFASGKGSCKECISIQKKEYYLANKNKIKEQSILYYKNNKGIYKKWYQANKEEKREYAREYQINNKERNKIISNKWKIANAEKIKADNRLYMNNRRSYDPLFKITCNLRTKIRNDLVKFGYGKTSKTVDILGDTFENVWLHLKKTFYDNYSMIWKDTYIQRIHIDHIIPISIAKCEEDLIKLNHYTNLQLLWAEENLKKGNKLL